MRKSGSAIVMVLMTTAIAGILVMIMSRVMSTRASEAEAFRIREARDRIGAQVHRALVSAGTLRKSSAVNTNLARCLSSSGGGCPNNGNYRPFTARVPSSPSAVFNIAGTEASPVRYSRTGQAGCSPASITCPFEAIAYFRPVCAPGNCKPADAIQVRARIRMAAGLPSVSPILGNFRLPAKDFPPTVAGEVQDEDVSRVFVSEILGHHDSQLCPPGARQVGVTATGMIKCECFGRYLYDPPRYDSTGRPICDVGAEPECEDKPLRGFAADGSPICTDLEADCTRTVPVDEEGRANCGHGWRLREVDDPNTCIVEPYEDYNPSRDDDDNGDDDEKGGYVRCSNINITCCRILWTP